MEAELKESAALIHTPAQYEAMRREEDRLRREAIALQVAEQTKRRAEAEEARKKREAEVAAFKVARKKRRQALRAHYKALGLKPNRKLRRCKRTGVPLEPSTVSLKVSP